MEPGTEKFNKDLITIFGGNPKSKIDDSIIYLGLLVDTAIKIYGDRSVESATDSKAENLDASLFDASEEVSAAIRAVYQAPENSPDLYNLLKTAVELSEIFIKTLTGEDLESMLQSIILYSRVPKAMLDQYEQAPLANQPDANLKGGTLGDVPKMQI